MSGGLLLTGSSGFVGQNLYPLVAENGFGKITSLVRQAPAKNIEYKAKDRFQLFSDFWNSNNNYDYYIHLAGKAHDLRSISDDSEYFKVNYELTKRLYDRFLQDKQAQVFVFISSVKAVADKVSGVLTESHVPEPLTAYGKSKLLAEQYIMDRLPKDKLVVILRPCMIHGPGNKGNLSLLHNIISRGIPWPLGSFNNLRSFLSVENLCFVILKILKGKIRSGIYNISDDTPLSTSELVSIISEVNGKRARIWAFPQMGIKFLAKLGNHTPFPLDEERLDKLTENYIVSNERIRVELQLDQMPISSREGLRKTFEKFDAS